MERASDRVERQAQAMRDASYIREGSRGWKRRRAHIERSRANEARMRQQERDLTSLAEANLDAKTGRAHESETDSDSREQRLMGNAVAEGKARRQQKTRADTLKQAYDQRKLLETQGIKNIATAHPSVQTATAQELIDAGWGEYERWRIPADWKTRRPGSRIPPASAPKLNGVTFYGNNPPAKTTKLA